MANLQRANLRGADLGLASLRRTNLTTANLQAAILAGADLREAVLFGASLRLANLSGANLRKAILNGADIREAILYEADIQNALVVDTSFINIDLSLVKGLKKVKHAGPSSIGMDTIYKSRGKIPEEFLRGCGFTDLQIEQAKLAKTNLSPSEITDIGYRIIELRTDQKPLEFYSCFISYSSKDEDFTKQLHARMEEEKLRTWYAPEDLKIGEEIRPGIDEAIRTHDKLLLILTEQSIESKWVEDEVESAFEKEAKQNKTVLFPIRLDNAVMETDKAWAAKIRRTRNIGDFRNWETHDDFQESFNRLLRDLKAEEKKKE